MVLLYYGKQKEFGCQAKNQSSEDALGFFLVVKINTVYSYSDGEEEEEQDTVLSYRKNNHGINCQANNLVYSKTHNPEGP